MEESFQHVKPRTNTVYEVDSKRNRLERLKPLAKKEKSRNQNNVPKAISIIIPPIVQEETEGVTLHP